MQADTPLILIAHGSRDPKWQQPFRRFLDKFEQRFPNRHISLCYMEICSPTLFEVCRHFYALGFRNVVVVPMFMASGGHVDHDIPKQVLEVQRELEGFSIALSSPIGEQDRVVDAMLESIYCL